MLTPELARLTRSAAREAGVPVEFLDAFAAKVTAAVTDGYERSRAAAAGGVGVGGGGVEGAAGGMEIWRRELVDDLLAGTASEHAAQRAESLGFRLAEPHALLAVAADRVLTDGDPVARTLRAGLHRRTRAPVLVAAKDDVLVALLPASTQSAGTSEDADRSGAGRSAAGRSAAGRSAAGRSGARRSSARRPRVALVRPAMPVGDLARLAYDLLTAPPAGSDAPATSGPTAPVGRPPDWRVAASRARPGAGSIAASWQEVRQTLSLAGRLRLTERVLPAARLDAYRLVLADRDAAARLAREVFGPLRAARGGAEPIVDTVLAVLDHGGNTGAARALHVSVRTVLYRLARLAELTGRDLADPTDRFTLYVAAVAARLTPTDSE